MAISTSVLPFAPCLYKRGLVGLLAFKPPSIPITWGLELAPLRAGSDRALLIARGQGALEAADCGGFGIVNIEDGQ